MLPIGEITWVGFSPKNHRFGIILAASLSFSITLLFNFGSSVFTACYLSSTGDVLQNNCGAWAAFIAIPYFFAAIMTLPLQIFVDSIFPFNESAFVHTTLFSSLLFLAIFFVVYLGWLLFTQIADIVRSDQ
jgi:hypothetical protein